ncbi:CD48 antigen-like [Chlamydotis macqueenii]
MGFSPALSCGGTAAPGLGTVVGGWRLRRSPVRRILRTECKEKMAVVLLFLFLFTMQAGAQQHPPSEVVGAVHGVVYLSPSLEKQASYHQIHWRRRNSLIIASRNSKGKVHYPNTPYKDRVELFPNHTLKISRLQKNDSSTYQVYLEDGVGTEHIETINLMVYELVPKPAVKARVTKDELARCEATLECAVGLEGVTYEWIPPSKLPLGAASAPEQHVSFNPGRETYVCKVSNPVSSNNASLTYTPPCSWTGEPSAAASHTISVLVALGHLLLPLLLTLA